jgi:hypothetical protein
MRATHPCFVSQSEAERFKAREERLGRTVSQPYQDEHGLWRVTVLHYGQ